MNTQQIGLLFIQLAVSSCVLAVVGMLYLQARESKRKYSLFAIRDKFLYLAATGVLPQDSMVFKVFYRAMNVYVAELDSVTIVSFLSASVAVRTQLEKENRERLLESVDRSDLQVREAVDQFIEIVMDAMRYNSPMLRLILAIARPCAGLFAGLHKLQKVRYSVYETYRYYETIHGRMHVA